MFKYLLAAITSAYLSVAGYNVVTSVPQETVYIIQTADGRGNGSGVLIAPNTLLTAAHVAEAAKFVPLFVKYDNRMAPVKIKSIDTNADLAILTVDGLDGPVASVATSIPDAGTNVIAVGYPMNKQFKNQITTEGKVLTTVDDKLMATAAILPGNSGGGLFSRNWLFKYELVGVTVSAPLIPLGWSAVPAFHIGNSVPSNYIWLFLHGNGIED